MTQSNPLSPEKKGVLSQEETIRRVVLVSQALAGSTFLFLALGIYLTITTGAWQSIAFSAWIVLAEGLLFFGLSYIRRGQMNLGGWIILGANTFGTVFAAMLYVSLGYVAVAYALVTSFFIIRYVMPKDTQRLPIIVASVGVVFAIAAEIINPAWRQTAQLMLTLSPIITAVLGIAFLAVLTYQAWQGRSIRNKLIIPTISLSLLSLLIVVAFTTVTSIQAIDENEEKRQQISYEIFLGRLGALEDLAVALATEVANNPEVQVAFANGDRERLTELTLNSYLLIDEQFGVPQHQFHLPPATSFLRLHNLEQYGDDLSSFRNTVLAANAEKRSVSGLEIGRGGLGVRGVVPVNYKNQHIGTVEFGINVDQTLLEAMKAQYGSDWQILLSQGPAEVATFEGATSETEGPLPELLFQASTLSEPYFAETESYQQALQGESAIFHREVSGQEVSIYSAPIYDYSGNIIGVLDIIANHTAVIEQQNTQITISILIALLSMVVVGGGIYFVTSRTLRPLEALTNVAGAVAGGDLSQKAPVESQDELGVFAQTFNTMTGQLQETLGDLEERVAARTRDLATVARISTVTATIRDPFEMLANMVHLTQRGFGLYHAHVFTFHKDAEELQIVACGYKEGDEHEGTHGTSVIPMAQEQSLVARAARTRQPVIVNDVTKDPGWLPNPLLPDTHAEMAVPMIVGDELLGVLDVQSENVDAFTEEDANIQMTLASQVATALQNAQAYTRAQKQAELESMVNLIGQRIQRATSIEDTLQTAIRELGTAIGASRVKASLKPASSGGSKAEAIFPHEHVLVVESGEQPTKSEDAPAE